MLYRIIQRNQDCRKVQSIIAQSNTKTRIKNPPYIYSLT